MVRVAINGYGRIGRVAHRIILLQSSSAGQNHPHIEVVAINAGTSTDLQGWAYLLKYDSNYGVLSQAVSATPSTDSSKPDFLGTLHVDEKDIPVFSQKDPTLLPWKDLQVDVVIESTGHFLTVDKAKAHLTSGAKKVVMSAPAKDDTPPFVLGVNDSAYKDEPIVSNESCTTNCITPVAKIMEDEFGVDKAMMTTIHAYTSDQRIQDEGHKDYRRARAGAHNIIPTTTGAAHATGQVVPPLQGIFNGMSIRVPVPTGSLSDFTFLLKKEVTVDEVNAVFKKAAANPVFKGILDVTEDPIVSSDIIGNSHSSIVDLSLTQVVGGNMVKVVAWYDNEWGYTSRLVEMVEKVGKAA